ncbi:MAG: ABC transporter substrate-binding protein [Enterococcus faecalis]|nr:ABC transporter substrate-binding protein [Enterococcus faecalis]
MKKRVILGTLVAATLLMTACGNSEATTKSESKGGSNALVVSTFGLSEDIVKKDIIAPFEKENEAKVTLEVGNSADRFTKLKNNPNAGIDVIELAQANAAQGGKDGLFEKITEKEVPNLSQLTPGAKEVFESGAGVPIAVNSIGIKGKISVPDVATTAGPLMLYVASEHAGQDITKDNGKAAFEAMKELKPNVVKTYSKSSDLANMFQSGEIEAAVVADFAVDIIQGAAENVTYIVPESGTYANYNTVNIPKKAQNKETAFKFVNARISEESQKAKAISLNEGPTNQQVTLSEKEAKNKTYGAIAERAKTVDFNFINSQLADWIDQWNRTMNQ